VLYFGDVIFIFGSVVLTWISFIVILCGVVATWILLFMGEWPWVIKRWY